MMPKGAFALITYSDVLKHLLAFTGIKHTQLAEQLEYDVSYISKWCRGTNLPSAKYARSINQKCSVLLADYLIQHNKSLDFFMEFSFPLPENEKVLDDSEYMAGVIYKLLDKAYKSANPMYSSQEEQALIVIGVADIFKMLRELFHQYSTDSITPFDIYLSMDMYFSESRDLFYLMENLTDAAIKVGITATTPKEHEAALLKAYEIIDRGINNSIEFYNGDGFRHFNAIALKDGFAAIFELDDKKIPQVMCVVKNTEEAQRIYTLLKLNFEKSKILLKAASKTVANISDYRIDFYSDNAFNILSAYGFEFLLPPEIISNIAQKAYDQSHSLTDMINIRKIQIAWEEIFERESINFFVLKSTLYRYIETGELIYRDVHYTMSIEERKHHFDRALELMNKNKNIRIFILDDEQVPENFFSFNIGIYLNRKKFFIKKYNKVLEQTNPYMFICNEKDVAEQLNMIFENIRKEPYCKEYTVEELAQGWEKYKNMILKIMDISKK